MAQWSDTVNYTGPTGLTLTFDQAGRSDNIGILLDDVQFEAIPEPATLLLLGSGLLGLAALRLEREILKKAAAFFAKMQG